MSGQLFCRGKTLIDQRDSRQEKLRARHLSGAQLTRLEELRKTNPAAKVEDLDAQPGLDEEPNPVALRYEVRSTAAACWQQPCDEPCRSGRICSEFMASALHMAQQLHVQWSASCSTGMSRFRARC